MGAPFVREHVFSVPSLLHSLKVVESFRVELSPVDVGWKREFDGCCWVIVNVVGGVDVGGLSKEFGGYDGDVDGDFSEVGGERTGYVK